MGGPDKQPGLVMALAAFPLRFAPVICLVFLVLLVGAAFGTRHFQIDASAETLLTRDNALYIESRAVSQRFSAEEFILVGLKPRQASLYSEETMQAIEDLSERLESLQRVEKVNALTRVPLIDGSSQVSLDSNLQQYTWQQQQYGEQRLREILTEHPVYTGLLVNTDHTATAIQVIFSENAELDQLNRQLLQLQQKALEQALSESETQTRQKLEQQLRVFEERLGKQRREEIRQIYTMLENEQAQFETSLGGAHVLAWHLINIITSDLVLFGSLIAGVISILLLFLFRDVRWLAISLLGCGISVVLTLGLFGWLGFRTTVISSNFVALQLILTLALLIHLIVHYRHLGRHHEDLDHHELLQRTVAEKLAPCFYAGITTSVGFAALLVSGLQPVISFGWMMILAMAVSITVSLLLFPAILSFLKQRLRVEAAPWQETLLDSLLEFCRTHGGLIITGSLAVTLVAAAGLFRLNAENSFLDYFAEDTRVHKELTFIDQELGGTTPLDIVYTPVGNEPELVLSSEAVTELQRIQASLNESPAVGKTLSVVNFAELARDLNGDRPITEYELNSLYELVDREVRNELLGAYMDTESGELRLNARIRDSTPGLDRQAFLQSIYTTLEEMGLPEDRVSVTNVFVLYQDILERLVDSQINTIGIVYAVLWLVMAVIFRSLRTATVALVPNVVVTVCVLGLMGWLNIPLDLMTITIAAIAMGISVDDTIHFIHHYLNPEKTGESRLAATIHSTGLALLLTSTVLACGFAVLGFSDFIPSVLFGLLTGTAMLLALVTDLTLLPVLLERFVKVSQDSEQSAVSP